MRITFHSFRGSFELYGAKYYRPPVLSPIRSSDKEFKARQSIRQLQQEMWLFSNLAFDIIIHHRRQRSSRLELSEHNEDVDLPLSCNLHQPGIPELADAVAISMAFTNRHLPGFRTHRRYLIDVHPGIVQGLPDISSA